MKKIIPWALPPVKGGAQGGYTPQPTPDPSPSCYDFGNASIVQSKSIESVAAGAGRIKFYAYESITISGAVVVDDSNVASIKIYANVAAGSIQVVRSGSSTQITTITVAASTGEEVTNTSTAAIGNKVWNLDLGNAMVTTSYRGAVGTVTGAGVTVTKVEILNSAGTVIQTWEP